MPAESDDYLVRYLVGDLPEDEAERLDERSIADDEFALRLRVLENDLVDRIVRGKARDLSLGRFAGRYQLPPYLRDKLRFAEAWHGITPSGSASATAPMAPVSRGFAWQSLAAAAVLAVALAGYLGVRNTRLREEVGRIDARREAVEQQNAVLQQELGRLRAGASARTPLTATVLLRPPRRGLGDDAATVAIPKGTELVALRLQLESETHATVWAALRDVASSRIVWRSPDLAVEGPASGRTVTLTVPAAAFRPQLYIVEVSAPAPTASADVLAHYAIRVVLE
jgi:hypothetical protein